MVNKIELLFPPGQAKEGPVGVFYGLCRFAVGDLVQITHKGTTFKQTFTITKKITKELLELIPKDYKFFGTPGRYKNPKAFWTSLETVYKTGIPGDAKVTFVFFKETGTEKVVTLDVKELAPEEAPRTHEDEPKLESTGLEQTLTRDLLEGYPAESEPIAETGKVKKHGTWRDRNND